MHDVERLRVREITLSMKYKFLRLSFSAFLLVMLVNGLTSMANEQSSSGNPQNCAVTVRAELPQVKHALRVSLDYLWLKEGRAVPADAEGATKAGMLPIGSIKDGQSKTFMVRPGAHEIVVGDDLYGSLPLSFSVSPGQAVKLVCGRNVTGITRRFASLTNSQRSYYFIRLDE